MSQPSYLESAFDLWVRHEGLPEPVAELRFHPSRKWRFDRAWPEQHVAVEIEGITYEDGGRHQRVHGFLGDAEKYEAALLLGWRVYRVPGQWIATPSRMIWRPEVMSTLRFLLGLS